MRIWSRAEAAGARSRSASSARAERETCFDMIFLPFLFLAGGGKLGTSGDRMAAVV
jgi:hypothetical protein